MPILPSVPTSRTGSELKQAAGNPLPYRVNAAIVWWAAGLFFLGTMCSPQPGAGVRAVFLVIAVIGSIVFLVRIARRGLLSVDLTRRGQRDLWAALRFFAWLMIGSPLTGRAVERALSVVAILGLVFVLLGPFFGGRC